MATTLFQSPRILASLQPAFAAHGIDGVGQALPFASCKSDRGDAAGSAGAVGRGLLKLRDFLREPGRELRGGAAGSHRGLRPEGHQVANLVADHHNPNDNALRVSDCTKATPTARASAARRGRWPCTTG